MGTDFPLPKGSLLAIADAAACEPCDLHANLGGLRFRFAAGLSVDLQILRVQYWYRHSIYTKEDVDSRLAICRVEK